MKVSNFLVRMLPVHTRFRKGPFLPKTREGSDSAQDIRCNIWLSVSREMRYLLIFHNTSLCISCGAGCDFECIVQG